MQNKILYNVAVNMRGVSLVAIINDKQDQTLQNLYLSMAKAAIKTIHDEIVKRQLASVGDILNLLEETHHATHSQSGHRD